MTPQEEIELSTNRAIKEIGILHGFAAACILIITVIALTSYSSALAGSPNQVVIEQPALESIGSSMFAARAGTIVISPSYDPYIKVGGVNKPFGFNISAFHPVSEYAFAGIRLDFLGDTFWAPSAVVGAKYTLKEWPLSPTVFTVGGLIMPMGGAGDQNRIVGAITGVGAALTLWHDKNNRFSLNVIAEGEKWTNFEGAVIHVGIGGGFRF